MAAVGSRRGAAFACTLSASGTTSRPVHGATTSPAFAVSATAIFRHWPVRAALRVQGAAISVDSSAPQDAGAGGLDGDGAWEDSSGARSGCGCTLLPN